MSNLRTRASIFHISEWNADENGSNVAGLMLDQGCQGQDRRSIRQVAVQPRGGMDTCVETRSACAEDNTQVDYQWGKWLIKILACV